jgi:hypothetical protein
MPEGRFDGEVVQLFAVLVGAWGEGSLRKLADAKGDDVDGKAFSSKRRTGICKEQPFPAGFVQQDPVNLQAGFSRINVKHLLLEGVEADGLFGAHSLTSTETA